MQLQVWPQIRLAQLLDRIVSQLINELELYSPLPYVSREDNLAIKYTIVLGSGWAA